MKHFVTLMMLVSLSAFAQGEGSGGGDRVGGGQLVAPLFELIIPASPLLAHPQSKKIAIYVNGSVGKEVSSFNTQNQVVRHEVEIGRVSDMSTLNKCAGDLKGLKLDYTLDPACVDDVGSRYVLSYTKESFAERTCGRVFTVDSACAKTVVSILDGFARISR